MLSGTCHLPHVDVSWTMCPRTLLQPCPALYACAELKRNTRVDFFSLSLQAWPYGDGVRNGPQ